MNYRIQMVLAAYCVPFAVSADLRANAESEPQVAAEGAESSAEPALQMMLINSDGTGLRQLASFDGRGVGSPQFSPDGKWIAYDTWTDDDFVTTTIEIMSLDGKGTRQVGRGAMPSWSPDGTQIVCHTYDSPQTIVVMDVDGGGRETVMQHWGSPRWSPVGNRIVSATPRGGIAIFDLTTGKEWIVAPNHSLHQGLSIYPDGRKICFGDASGGVALATLTADEKKATVRWILRDGQTYNTSWSPDGRQVIFNLRPRPGAIDQMYLWNVDSDEKPRRLPGQSLARDNHDMHWSPDGKTIVFMSVRVAAGK
jgi:Tol biopolymer transport system component